MLRHCCCCSVAKSQYTMTQYSILQYTIVVVYYYYYSSIGQYTHLGSILIFTVLILLIHEHNIFLQLFVSSLISFISVLQFSMYKSFVSLGRYTPNYFILFVAMVNGIVSLISLSVFSLLLYRNARECCVLILYPATLLY